MAFGFPYPKYSQRRTFNASPDELFAVVRSALQDLGWRYKVLWGKEFEAEVPTAHWSWHHVFKVRFFAGGIIEAESSSAYSEILFDLGRNRRNVEKFFARVVDVSSRDAADQRRDAAERS
jgi:hypothetical protein